MNYQVGDKVKLESGKIVTITNIENLLEGIVYGYGHPVIIPITEKIIEKIED